MKFKLVSEFKPKGDQPEAIKRLAEGIMKQDRHQVLLGVTGSGKTFTMANVIAAVGKPVLVISHNKTLAAQLYTEFRQFFPENAVEYFVSYYDYYQPEAYVPQTDTYIEKDASINDHIDQLRLKATASLLSRRDVIIVASVSCIYNLGSPADYRRMLVSLKKGQRINRDKFLRSLVDIRYQRNDVALERAKFRVRGDVIEIHPAYLDTALRVELLGEEVEKITEFDVLTRKTITEKQESLIYPATHFITSPPMMEQAIESVREELSSRLAELRKENKLLEAQRLETKTSYDIEMMQEMGYCQGIENYSRHLAGRKPGERPACLVDYFPSDFLVIIDESHVTVPQLNSMYNGDYARKKTLVDFGFRLPSAIDNRPLKFGEFEQVVSQRVYVSATPGPYEMEKSGGKEKGEKKGGEKLYPNVVEQIVRPTGLVDPAITIKPTRNQIDDLIKEIEVRTKRKERVFVTTLTKRMAEDLASYLEEKGLRVRYLHSEIKTLDRVKILQDLRKGEFDCLVGINLLREGLDLPEVSLVAILDADKEGFLRSETSLIQICGRAARNVNGRIIMYADDVTFSMKRAVAEMDRRRKKQAEYNAKHNIVPKTVEKEIRDIAELRSRTREDTFNFIRDTGYGYSSGKNVPQVIDDLKRQMMNAADNLEFEMAAIIRDRIFELEKKRPHSTLLSVNSGSPACPERSRGERTK